MFQKAPYCSEGPLDLWGRRVSYAPLYLRDGTEEFSTFFFFLIFKLTSKIIKGFLLSPSNSFFKVWGLKLLGLVRWPPWEGTEEVVQPARSSASFLPCFSLAHVVPFPPNILNSEFVEKQEAVAIPISLRLPSPVPLQGWQGFFVLRQQEDWRFLGIMMVSFPVILNIKGYLHDDQD